MKAQLLLVADYANADSTSRKLNILGVFGQILANKFPCQHRRMTIVATLRPELGDSSNTEKTIKIIIADADGIVLLEISQKVEIPSINNGIRRDINLLWELNNFTFPKEGLYGITIYVDDQTLETTSLELIKIDE